MRRLVSDKSKIKNPWSPWDCSPLISRPVRTLLKTSIMATYCKFNKTSVTFLSVVSRISRRLKRPNVQSTLQELRTRLTKRVKKIMNSSFYKLTVQISENVFLISRSIPKKLIAMTWSKFTGFSVFKPPVNLLSTNSSKSSNPTVFTSIIGTCVF